MTEAAGLVNKYICGRGHIAITINAIEGVTPFTMGCRGHTTCKLTSYSQMYRIPQGDLAIVPQFEWRRPTKKELRLIPRTSQQAVTEHLRQGGLMIYPVTVRTMVAWGRMVPQDPTDALLATMQINKFIADHPPKETADDVTTTTPSPMA